MFCGCTSLSSVTILAPSDQITITSDCCYKWLEGAGTMKGITRTLKVKDEVAYNALVNNSDYLPAIWQKGAEGPKAPSPGHRPGYNGNQKAPCKGKSIVYCPVF